MSQMTTSNDIIILEGPMKKKVSSIFSSKWVTRYYLLSTNTITELLKEPSHGIDAQQLLENSHETKSISWAIKDVSVIAPVNASRDTFFNNSAKIKGNSSLKIVFENGECLQLVTPEPKAADLWIRNIQKQKSIKEKESIAQESVLRIMDDVGNNWDENMNPLDRNIEAVEEKIAKKVFGQTPLQLKKLVIDDQINTTNWRQEPESFLNEPKKKKLILKRQMKHDDLWDISPTQETHFDRFLEPKQFAEKMHQKDSENDGVCTPVSDALTPRASLNIPIAESPIPLRRSTSIRKSSSRRRRKSNMAFMSESIDNFVKIADAYTELQKKDFYNQYELKENEKKIEELRSKLNDTNNVIEEIKNQVDVPDTLSQHQELLEREERIKIEKQKIIEAQKATIKSDMEYRKARLDAQELRLENKKLEELHKKKANYIEEQAKKVEKEEKDLAQRDINMTREMQQLRQKIEEYNQRVNQLNAQVQHVAKAEKKLKEQKQEIENRAKKLHQSQQSNTLETGKKE